MPYPGIITKRFVQSLSLEVTLTLPIEQFRSNRAFFILFQRAKSRGKFDRNLMKTSWTVPLLTKSKTLIQLCVLRPGVMEEVFKALTGSYRHSGRLREFNAHVTKFCTKSEFSTMLPNDFPW